jgi:hypothetical protein
LSWAIVVMLCVMLLSKHFVNMWSHSLVRLKRFELGSMVFSQSEKPLYLILYHIAEWIAS